MEQQSEMHSFPPRRPFGTIAAALIFAIFLVAGLPACAAGEGAAPADEQQRDASPEEIARWVQQLDSDEFATREEATLALSGAGGAAVEPVAAVIDGTNLEVTVRGIHVLRELALDGDLQTEQKAREALERIRRLEVSAASRRAAATLAALDELRQERTLDQLAALGAVVRREAVELGLQIVPGATEIVIGEQWKGSDEDLLRLKWLPQVEKATFEGRHINDRSLRNLEEMKGLKHLVIKRTSVTEAVCKQVAALESVQYVDVFYSPVGDAAVEPLAALEGAQWIKLYGTKVTPAAAQKLQETLAGVNVDHRRGAFLGVGCQAHALGCAIIIIHPGSAAERAGLRTGDVISKYNGQPVPDFETLTRLIGENVSGDKIELEVLRGTETLDKEIELGEWD